MAQGAVDVVILEGVVEGSGQCCVEDGDGEGEGDDEDAADGRHDRRG